jgi:hypothetical protein
VLDKGEKRFKTGDDNDDDKVRYFNYEGESTIILSVGTYCAVGYTAG